MSRTERFGLSAALTTPFAENGRVDIVLATSHAKACLAKGCDSVTLFGTTGEGTSISDAERIALFEAFIAGGIPADKIVVGVAETAIDEAIAKVRLALKGGCRAVLLLPPFYFKGVPEDGLFGWFEAVLSGLDADARDIILYHIPSVAQVGLPVPLVRRITDAFPKAIRGVKDSGGHWPHTKHCSRPAPISKSSSATNAISPVRSALVARARSPAWAMCFRPVSVASPSMALMIPRSMSWSRRC